MKIQDSKNISIRPLESVWVRRGANAVRKISSKMLIPNIKAGKLFGDDEISGDGTSWVRLERHSQLSHYFRKTADHANKDMPPGAQEKLEELAGMLDELNS